MLRNRRSVTSLVLALAIGALPTPASALQPQGATLLVNAGGVDQIAPRVAMRPDGEFVIAWYLTGQYDVRARRFSSSGAPLTGDLVVNAYTTGNQFEPKVAYLPSGNFVVSWWGQAPAGSNSEVTAAIFNPSGGVVVPEFKVNVTTALIQANPAVAAAPNGDFYVAWQDARNDGEVLARRFSSAGVAQTGEVLINTYTTGQQEEPTVCILPSATVVGGHDVVVAWEGPGATDAAGNVWTRRMALDGTPLGIPVRAGATTQSGGHTAGLACTSPSDFVVSWDDDLANVIRARRFDGDGNPLSGEVLTDTPGAGDVNQNSKITPVSGGGFVLHWRDATATSLWLQEYDELQRPLAVPLELAVDRGVSTGLASTHQGQLVLSWEDGGADRDIFAQRYLTDRINADQFEGGSFADWTSEVDPDADVAISALAGMEGTANGLRITIDDADPAFLVDHRPLDEDELRLRFHLDASAYAVGTDGDRTKILQVFESAPLFVRRLVTVVLRQQAGQDLLLAKVHLDDDSWANTGFHAISPGPHRVEFEWSRASTFGPPDGALRLLIDGLEVADLGGLDNGTSAADAVRMGAISVKPGATGQLDFDLYDVRRETLPGAF